MKLRCFFNLHPWNYRAFGDAVLRLCKNGCCPPEYWSDGRWKVIQPVREKTRPVNGAGWPA